MSNQPDTPHDPKLEQEGCEGSASPTCSALLKAVADLLPHHAAACVSGFRMKDRPWSWHTNSEGKPLVTQESCQCSPRMKEIRAMLPLGHERGFSQNADVEARRD